MAEFALRDEFAALAAIEDPVRRRARFVALLSREFRNRGLPAPSVVGGLAVEIYTLGGYTTGDIDLKADPDALRSILRDLGFVERSGTFAHEAMDLYVQWLGGGLAGPAESPAKALIVNIGEGLSIRLVGFEDLIVDRLCAAKWWKDADSRLWARVLYRAALLTEDFDFDLAYVRERARDEKVEDELDSLLESEARPGAKP